MGDIEVCDSAVPVDGDVPLPGKHGPQLTNHMARSLEQPNMITNMTAVCS